MATLDLAHQRELERAYIEWIRDLEQREIELDRAGLQIINDKWLTMAEKEMTAVDAAREQIFNSLSKKARDELKSRERELERTVEVALRGDARYSSLLSEIESDKNRITKGKKALGDERAVVDRNGTRLAQVCQEDEQKLFQQTILTLEVGLHHKEEQLHNMTSLAIAEEHARLLDERIKAAHASSDQLTAEVREALSQLTVLIRDVNASVASARRAVHTALECLAQITVDVADLVHTYSQTVHRLADEFETMTVDRVHQQGSPEFFLMLARALQTLPKLQKRAVLESRCGRERKIDYKRMTYDSGSDAYDGAYDSDEEERANDGKLYPFQPEVYQRAVSAMSEPSWGMNLLMYWGPGSGKTCAILLGLQKAAQHYLHHPPRDADGAVVEAGALVLMQNTAGLEKYFGEINKFCTDKNDMKGMRLRQVPRPKFKGGDDDDEEDTATPHSLRSATNRRLRGGSTHSKPTTNPYRNSHEWSFVTKDTSRVVLRVIVHKMSSPLLVAGDWRKGPLKPQKPPAGISYWELPRVGCVIVDEAHNLFDTSQMKTSQHSNHATKFIEQMKARPDIWRLLSTGTPVADSDSFAKLEVLLDFLRHPSPPGAQVLSETPMCAHDASPPGGTKMTDIDALEAAAKNSKQINAADALKKYGAERAARKRWFYQKDDGDYAWLPCAEHTFKQMTYGYVSHVNMEADATAFPQFGVQWGGTRYPKGIVHAKFRMVGTFGTPEAAVTKGKRKKAQFIPADAEFEIFGLQRHRKGLVGAGAIPADDPLKKPQLFELPRKYTDRWTDSEIDAYLISLNTDRTNACRYMILGDETLIKSSLRFFNAPCNKAGDYIRIVMGLSTVKEQVTISDTHFVHLLQAPTSATMMNQVIRRVARRCSMSNIEPVDKWMVTIVIYHTPDSTYEAKWLIKSMSAANTPVELAYRALQSTAVDCALYSAMTGITCDSHEIQPTQTYCLYPRGGAQRLIKMVTGADGTMYSEPDCVNDEGIPGGLLEYDVWDELLYQLLSKSSRYVPRPIPPEEAPDLIRRFPDTVRSNMRVGIWVEEGQQPKLTFARDVRPEVLARWIDATSDHVGNSVLYLLKAKRDGADQKSVHALERKAKPYVTRVDADVRMRDSLEAKFAALHTMRGEFACDIDSLKSASLRVDTAGRAAQQLVERNARYI
ncbi:hypothetical protein JKP88DRAFT_240887 [Tribonema minus]|uniref:Helicase ATP-binding domain-containing protein n=1 Tax=Tribonema minus TaxID=303371 RepID=A0A836CIA5_9STRA|nr:hypothetical protein JKP88DRAFT_240887 [Tribonema minus]